MKPLTFRLRAAPEQRLDLSPLNAAGVAGKSLRDIAAIALQTSRQPASAGDVFAISGADPQHILFEGGSERFDGVGEGMSGGSILVEGEVGARAGRLMSGGRLVVKGDVGAYAASGMSAGAIEIAGNAGERLGGPLAGELAGMSGGLVVLRGDAGERAGDRLRRGALIIEGDAGQAAGARMAAGTLIILGAVGAHAGYLMRRGTMILGQTGGGLDPSFLDCGVQDLVILRLLAKFIASASPRAAALLRAPMRRFAGDMAVLGKGEVFIRDAKRN